MIENIPNQDQVAANQFQRILWLRHAKLALWSWKSYMVVSRVPESQRYRRETWPCRFMFKDGKPEAYPGKSTTIECSGVQGAD